MNYWNLWKLGASRFHLQLASLCRQCPSENKRLKITLVEGRDPSGPDTLTHQPLFIIGSLY